MTLPIYYVVRIVWHWKWFCDDAGRGNKKIFLQRNWKHLSTVCVRFDPFLNRRCRGFDVKGGRQSPACEVPVSICLSCPRLLEVRPVRWFAAGWWQAAFFGAASSQWHKIVSWFWGGVVTSRNTELGFALPGPSVYDLAPISPSPLFLEPSTWLACTSWTWRQPHLKVTEQPYQIDKDGSAMPGSVSLFNLLFLKGE